MSLSTVNGNNNNGHSRRNQRMLSATKDQGHFHSSNANNNGRHGGSPTSGGNAGHGVVQVRTIPTMRSTVSLVEKELVQNHIHKAESIATQAINSFLDDPTQFKHLAATASGPKVVQALTPFWTLATLLVQCKLLLYHQGMEESASAEDAHNDHRPAISPSNLSFASTPTQSPSLGAHASPVAAENHEASLLPHPEVPAEHVATLSDLEAFLPRLCERVEAIRENSVPPQARIFQTQVLRSLKRHNEALRYMEDTVLPNALETTAFVSDSDEGDTQGGGAVGESGGGGAPSNSNPQQQQQRESSPSAVGRAQTPMPTVPPGARKKREAAKDTPRESPLLKDGGGGGFGETGTPRYKSAHGASFSSSPSGEAPNQQQQGDNGAGSSNASARRTKRAKTEKRTTRMLSWTPKTTLTAIEVYISICFESSSIPFNLGDDSGQQEPVAADQVTGALDLAEKRCIEFLSMYADPLNRRLRPCFPTTMDSPSVYDEVLSRVESRHEKTLQVWNHQQMSYVTNPVQSHATGPDTPPHRPYDDTRADHGEEDKAPRSMFPHLPLPFGGGGVANDTNSANGSGDLEAPATQRNQGGAGSVLKALGSQLQNILTRLWAIMTKRNLSYAAIGCVTLFSLSMLLLQYLSRGAIATAAVATRARPPVQRIAAAASSSTPAAATQQAVARRMQAF